MAFSLYAATISSYQQILGSLSGLLVKAEAFCVEKSINHDDIIQARLAPDMLPFAYQVKSTAVHSLGAIEGVRRGVFSPDMTPPPETFTALKARITETLAALEEIEPSEVDGFVGRDMRFAFGARSSTSPPKTSSSPSPSPTFTSMRRRPTTFCVGRACRSASGISRRGFA